MRIEQGSMPLHGLPLLDSSSLVKVPHSDHIQIGLIGVGIEHSGGNPLCSFAFCIFFLLNHRMGNSVTAFIALLGI